MLSIQSQNIKTLLYISFLLHPKRPVYLFPAYFYFIYQNIQKMKSYCNVVPCPRELIEFYLNRTTDSEFDVDNCVIVPNCYADLIQNSFNLVKLHLKNTDHEFRIVHAIPSDNLTNEFLLSDQLFFNINKTKFCNKMRVSELNQNLIKIAIEIEIVLVNTQYEISSSLVDLLVKNYFQTPRIFYKFDTFSINIEKYAPEYVAAKFQLGDLQNLYFKCKRIGSAIQDDSPNGLFCVLGETALKQGPNIRGYLPASIFKLCASNNSLCLDKKYEEVILSKCPHGLEEYLKKIETAVQPFLPKNKLNLPPAFLIQGSKGIGKNHLINALASKLGVHVYRTECSDIQTQTHAQTEAKLRNVFMKSKLTAPCLVVLNNFEIFGKDNEGTYDPRLISYFQTELELLFDDNNYPIILICLSNTKEIHSDLSRTFLETFTIDAPNQNQRTSLLCWLTRSKNIEIDFDLGEIGAKTHGFMLGDLDALVYHSLKMGHLENGGVAGQDICLNRANFDKALDLMQKSYTSSLGAPKVPKVLWSDVGGLFELKREIMRTINLPLQHPNLLKIAGLKRSGILLFGPPGTGKTLIAKAVATECGLCFLSVKGPELLNMYVGQSEQNVRQVFERAREASPCIIFFDELDSLAPNRGISGDSGGVMDRVVSQLLSEMDGLNEAGTVFIIGATNRPDLLDPALLRPGRFDKLLYVGPCRDIDSKCNVLKALTRKFTLSSDVKLDKIASECPEYVTGADLYSICANAWFSAVKRTIENIENGTISNENLSSDMIKVESIDFSKAANELKPSISDEDMKYFETLKQDSAKTTKKTREKKISA